MKKRPLSGDSIFATGGLISPVMNFILLQTNILAWNITTSGKTISGMSNIQISSVFPDTSADYPGTMSPKASKVTQYPISLIISTKCGISFDTRTNFSRMIHTLLQCSKPM